MIPFLLIAGGAYLLGDAMRVKKLSMGDYLKEKTIEAGDEVVFEFKDDSWLEMYENEEFPTSEIAFPAGEAFEVIVFDMDATHFHVKFPDETIAFIPKDEVSVIAVIDEVATYKKGGPIKPRRPKYWANAIAKKGDKYYVIFVDENDKVVKRKAFDKLEDAQVYKINYNNPDEKVGTKAGYLKLDEVVNVNGEKAYVSPSDSYYGMGKFEGSFENYSDDYPIVFGNTKEEVIENLKYQLESTPPKKDYFAEGGEIKPGDRVRYKGGKYTAVVIDVFEKGKFKQLPYASIRWDDEKAKKREITAYLEDLEKVPMMASGGKINLLQLSMNKEFSEVSDYFSKTKDVKGTVARFFDTLEKSNFSSRRFTTTELAHIFEIPDRDRTNKQKQLLDSIKTKMQANLALKPEYFQEIVDDFKANQNPEDTANKFVKMLRKRYSGIKFKMKYLYPLFDMNPRELSENEIKLTHHIRDLAKSIDKSDRAWVYSF